MSLLFEENIKRNTLLDIAKRMLVAARTAPKGKGVDNLVLSLAEKDEIENIAAVMKKMVDEGKAADFFNRDADNILQSEILVLIGTKIKPVGVKYCGLCGYTDCDEKNNYPSHPCSFNTGDLGIAIGSAVSVAIDARVDNRIMFSVGKAVKEMGLLGEDAKIIYGIPLSCTGKNPVFR
ncbi:MAG: ferredoxin domain-containing protein [Bacillota bacterium]